ALALRGPCAVARLPFHLIEARPQDLERPGLVLVLRLLVLLDHDEATRQMGNPHRTVGRVDRLTAGSACPEDVNAQILLVDADIDLLRLRQHGNSGSRGVDAPARLGLGYALDAVDTRLEFQPSEH